MWSFGVVLWELLTGEVPYKGVDVAAIVWGVGSNSLHLPVPTDIPDGFSLLLKQCWNGKAKHRPEFRQILLHLDILANDTTFGQTPTDTYFQTQSHWKQEIEEELKDMKNEETEMRRLDMELIK